ncbi:MAG TPA: cation:proton antiporter [Candidatus Thermoplasmatota archaeon]
MVGGPEHILLIIGLIILGSKLGGEVARRLKQPPVVGEILVGVLLGPTLFGLVPSFDILHGVETFFSGDNAVLPTQGDFMASQELHVLAILAELGVLLLLFEVGLESNLQDLKRVGVSASLVGIFGVLFSLVFGAATSWMIARYLDWVITPTAVAAPNMLHIFIGAALTATSVGITARVLSDLQRIRTVEAQIILGAAVLDDVLGLIVLAIVGGLVTDPGSLSAVGVAKVFVISLGFFFAAIALGRLFAPKLIDFVHRTSKSEFMHLGFAMVFMVLISYLATYVGLASIVGAFAAGLALSGSTHRHVIFENLKPIGSVFVGFFFVVLGTRVNLREITGDTALLVLGIGVLLSVVGIVAKLLCGLGVVGIQASRYIVGVGMVPRGEVGLIFALFGLEHGLVNNWQYTTVILVVLITTLIAPFWLKALEGRFVAPTGPESPGAARLTSAVEH